ncbi:MAG: Ankyrin [Rickettsiaceae bacterium]|jgi:ankyrin repeat protein|nr:Ankyrin [Rickettsiaceae bacterium]
MRSLYNSKPTNKKNPFKLDKILSDTLVDAKNFDSGLLDIIGSDSENDCEIDSEMHNDYTLENEISRGSNGDMLFLQEKKEVFSSFEERGGSPDLMFEDAQSVFNELKEYPIHKDGLPEKPITAPLKHSLSLEERSLLQSIPEYTQAPQAKRVQNEEKEKYKRDEAKINSIKSKIPHLTRSSDESDLIWNKILPPLHERSDFQQTRLNKNLIKAVEEINNEWARSLIENGADINFRNIDGETPTIYCVKMHETLNPYYDILVNHPKLDPNIKDNVGNTVFHYFPVQYDDRAFDMLIKGLVRNKISFDLNQKNNAGYTPLQESVKFGSINIANILIDNNVDVNQIHEDTGKNLLHMIAPIPVENKKDEIFAFIECIIFEGVDIEAKDKEGKTPLIYAIESVNIPTIELFINYGAGLNEKTLKEFNNLTSFQYMLQLCKYPEKGTQYYKVQKQNAEMLKEWISESITKTINDDKSWWTNKKDIKLLLWLSKFLKEYSRSELNKNDGFINRDFFNIKFLKSTFDPYELYLKIFQKVKYIAILPTLLNFCEYSDQSDKAFEVAEMSIRANKILKEDLIKSLTNILINPKFKQDVDLRTKHYVWDKVIDFVNKNKTNILDFLRKNSDQTDTHDASTQDETLELGSPRNQDNALEEEKEIEKEFEKLDIKSTIDDKQNSQPKQQNINSESQDKENSSLQGFDACNKANSNIDDELKYDDFSKNMSNLEQFPQVLYSYYPMSPASQKRHADTSKKAPDSPKKVKLIPLERKIIIQNTKLSTENLDESESGLMGDSADA